MMTGAIRAALAAAMILFAGTASQSSVAGPDPQQHLVELANSVQPKHGQIVLTEADAKLDLGNQYDFYSGNDIRTILVDLWNNPPGSEEHVLGIVMPAGKSPLSDSWGAVISFDDVGYVTDDDAVDADFGELLQQLKDGAESANEERQRQGYPPMHVAGWAEDPKYDVSTHSVVWAQDLRVEGHPVDTLNYDLRTLGRKGVLSVNFISGMPDLGNIRIAASSFADHATFNPGARYEDYKQGTDKAAGYGIGGLVAAGVGLAVAKKLGLLAIILKFGKVIAIAVVAAFATMRKKIARLFGIGADEHSYAESSTDESAEAVSEDAPEQQDSG